MLVGGGTSIFWTRTTLLSGWEVFQQNRLSKVSSSGKIKFQNLVLQGAARPLVRPWALFSLDAVVDFECIIIHIHHKKPARYL